MPEFSELIRQGSAHAWLFMPSAILLGALHGLEPGHSKTMMAAFIVAVRGTVAQAVMLGLAATVSHTAIVWAIAFAGMYLWQGADAETFEPYFQLVSAAIIIAMALWMMQRTRQDQKRAQAAAGRARGDHGGHDHGGHGRHGHHDHEHQHGHLHRKHEHVHGNGAHAHKHAHSAHTHDHGEIGTDGYQDAHELAHANDIRRRFTDRNVTTWQIILFGLTGGLIPCPAAITVLLLCLQLKQFTLGFVLVLCFSIGLAITLVLVGAAAALSVRHATKRWSWFNTAARKAPYLSGILLIGVGLYVGLHGWQGLAAQG